jgi:hypothetical protein
MRVLTTGGGVAVIQREVRLLMQNLRDVSLLRASALVERSLESAAAWLLEASDSSPREAGARRLALTLGRSLEAALLARHAQWALDNHQGLYALAATRRFCATGINQILAVNYDDAKALLDENPPRSEASDLAH